MTKKQFNKLYKDHLGGLVAYLMRYAKINFDDAIDVSQTCSINAYKYLVINNKEISCSFKTFLYTCARNEVVDFIRRNKINNKNEINYSSFLSHNSDNDLQLEDIFRTDLDDTTFNEVCSNEMIISLQNYIKSFKTAHPEYLSVFTLYSLENKSYKECAEILNIPIGTVKSRIFKAKNILQNNMPETLKESIISK